MGLYGSLPGFYVYTDYKSFYYRKVGLQIPPDEVILRHVWKKIVAQLSARTNVYKDFKCLYEHKYLHLLERLLAVVVDSI